ncbi:hypothetical protein DIPPA_25548 [Diplonema papillatum]|nr:hypothetical protein DIPPA_25548 [Diplonema papillatum]
MRVPLKFRKDQHASVSCKTPLFIHAQQTSLAYLCGNGRQRSGSSSTLARLAASGENRHPQEFAQAAQLLWLPA